MSDRLAVLPQYLLPKRALTALAGKLAGLRGGRLTTGVIRWFIGRYEVNMDEAAEPDPAAYPTFNDFFTRALREDARTLADADFICPVDGAISQFGPIRGDQVFQAKGHHYTCTDLLGGDRQLAAHFEHGQFATLYLSPRDYHRIHMPCDGRLTEMIYVPGALFSVNPTTARGVPGLFARNERVVCVFASDAGPFVMVLVGATIVGSMATVWHGVVNPPRRAEITKWRYDDGAIMLRQGEEMGRFLLGSTVVMLFPKPMMAFHPAWAPASSVRLGERMGRALPPAAVPVDETADA
ncbi:archaetidylserine decarboxylase [Denitromonas iodatirespirans]|uniref:Phosphatidylserine decarboxylase proenzyme n=1 Tax=Denitromonas iodatirespirans TaxID=2795389 RepID=A0A944DGG6_DENI1|nr:archaetidylserine decarboxylase [Denitromonas iodatirespirans]MBT0963883.1 phosphatidylserine decarboxylase [Denitromonas iodatirespirans]